jgi:hypothetical protein
VTVRVPSVVAAAAAVQAPLAARDRERQQQPVPPSRRWRSRRLAWRTRALAHSPRRPVDRQHRTRDTRAPSCADRSLSRTQLMTVRSPTPTQLRQRILARQALAAEHLHRRVTTHTCSHTAHAYLGAHATVVLMREQAKVRAAMRALFDQVLVLHTHTRGQSVVTKDCIYLPRRSKAHFVRYLMRNAISSSSQLDKPSQATCAISGGGGRACTQSYTRKHRCEAAHTHTHTCARARATSYRREQELWRKYGDRQRQMHVDRARNICTQTS